jgi:hypothetical protein
MRRLHSKRLAGMLALTALALGLIGWGSTAAFTDGGTATEQIAVGNLAITVTSGTAGAVVVNSGTTHTVTFNAGTLMSSAAGTSPLAFTVNSTGSIPAWIHVNQSVPVAPFTSLLAPPADVQLSQGQHHDYAGGLSWPELTNTDMLKNTSIVYTIVATEGQYVPPLGTMTHIGNTYTIRVDKASCPGHTAVQIPAGYPLATYRGSWSNGWAGLGPHTGGLTTADANGIVYWTGTDADIPGSGGVQFTILGPTNTQIYCTIATGL